MAAGSRPPSPRAAGRGGATADDDLPKSMTDALATPTEEALLLRLRAALGSDLAPYADWPDVAGDFRLLRTLRAFDHSLPEAVSAFRAHLAIRQSRGLDAARAHVLERFSGRNIWDFRAEDAPHGDVLFRYMPEIIVFAKSAEGDPVGLGLWGQGRPSQFVVEVEDWQTKFLEYYCFMNEAKMLLLDHASREQNRLCHFVQIFDLENWTIMTNSDPAWTKYTMDFCRPVGETYHDCNACFIAIRATSWARMAYGIIKPALPKKVTDKIAVHGDDFARSKELRTLVEDRVVQRLIKRSYAPTSRIQEGRALLRPRHSFELVVDVPCGGAVSWRFGVEVDRRWPETCLPLPVNICGNDLVFSTTSQGSSAPGVKCTQELPELEDLLPHRIGGDSNTGRLATVEGVDGSYCVTMRWENRHALLTAKTLEYRVEVELPAVGLGAGSVAVGHVKSRGLWAWSGRHLLCLAGLVCLLLALYGRLESELIPSFISARSPGQRAA